MNTIVCQAEKIEHLNRTYADQNCELAAMNDEFRARIIELESELATLRYRNRVLLQDLSRHREKTLPALEQYVMCDADIPPSTQSLSATPPPQECVLTLKAPSERSKRKRTEPVTSAPEDNTCIIKSRRVKIRTCYTLPSLKSKLRKGDQQMFRK